MIKTRPVSKMMYKPAIVGFGLALISVLTAISAPLGSRGGLWDYTFSLLILNGAAYMGIFAALLCLPGIILARPRGKYNGFIYSLVGLIMIVPMILFLQMWQHAKQNLPPIQDITTNIENLPTFWYAPNSQEYGGFEAFEVQQQAYPDIQPLVLPISTNKSYDLVLKLMHKKGWKLWTPSRVEMHIEATETTFWFGFSDDIVVHIAELKNGDSQIEMRSTSRFGGGGDGGTNANRIRTFLKDLKVSSLD
ncbi:MAG: DUF1499 domain-containing protein [Thiohalomonadales bacterium]